MRSSDFVPRRMILVCAAFMAAVSSLEPERVAGEERETSEAPAGVLASIKRTLVKEPQYVEKPKYCLIVLGTDAASEVWMVEDGNRLYIDRDGDGDLTDDGPPLLPANVRELGSLNNGPNRWDFNYLLSTITPPDGSRHSDVDLRRWNYGEKNDSYGLSLSVDGKLPMYAGWFGTLWSDQAATAPVVHFGGPVTPHILRRKRFTLGKDGERLSLAFMNAGQGDGATSRVSIEALPKTTVPKLTIDWPVPTGAAAKKIEYPLPDRCCYWEFYDANFRAPDGIVPGTAKLTVSFDGGEFPLPLVTDQLTVPVVDKGPVDDD